MNAARIKEQLTLDVAELCTDGACKPYLPWDWVRVVFLGHEFEGRVDRLEVGVVEGVEQVVVCTSDGRVWQQSYLGGWLLSWGGTLREYEPLPGESRIAGRRSERQRAKMESRKGGRP